MQSILARSLFTSKCWTRGIPTTLSLPSIATILAWAAPFFSSYFLWAPQGIIFFNCSRLARGFSSPLLSGESVSALVTFIGPGTVLICPVETIGYIGRAMSSKESPDWTLGSYLVQTLFLLLAPALLAASIYMLLGRIILALQAESHSLLKKKWLTKIFVTGDVLSFLLQGAGRHFIIITCSIEHPVDQA